MTIKWKVRNKFAELETWGRGRRMGRWTSLAGLKGRRVERCDTVWDKLWAIGDEGEDGR